MLLLLLLAMIHIPIPSRRPKINDEISMEVFSTEPIDSITYLVFGKNDLIYSRTLNVPHTNFFNFKILTTIAMLPYSFVIVYAIRPNGDIMSDKLEINFKNELQNSVSCACGKIAN